jgi:hypothetical protein
VTATATIGRPFTAAVALSWPVSVKVTVEGRPI